MEISGLNKFLILKILKKEKLKNFDSHSEWDLIEKVNFLSGHFKSFSLVSGHFSFFYSSNQKNLNLDLKQFFLFKL